MQEVTIKNSGIMWVVFELMCIAIALGVISETLNNINQTLKDNVCQTQQQ